jgi:hypothetical protein
MATRSAAAAVHDAGEEKKRGIKASLIERMHRADMDFGPGHDLTCIVLLGLGFAMNPVHCHPSRF